MKKIFISVALLALPFFGAMAQSIVATNQIIDCGQVLYQTPATFDFEVKNKSNKPVRITDVCTSCGCTDVAFPREAIAAGEKINFTKELLRRRYSEEDMAKIWGGNWLRALEANRKL